MEVTLRGSRLDLSALFEDEGDAAPDEADTGPQLRVALDIGTLILADAAPLGAVRGSLLGRPGDWRSIDLVAVPPGGGSVTLRLTPDGARQRLTLRSDNAGGVLRALDVTDTVRGGALAVDGVTANGTIGPIDGTMVMTDFVLRDVPAVARLLQLTSPIGIIEAFRQSGLRFSRLESGITYRGRPQEVVLRDGVASGADLGLTFDGRIEIDAERLDLAGTLAPMNAINSIVGAIPLIGDILTGGNSGGLIAFTYAVTGSFGDPTVSVNPLSVLAPGIVRRLLFERTPSSG